MTHPAPLTKEWRPAPSTPWLGEVLLGAVGAVHGELPAIALRAPGVCADPPAPSPPG